MHILFQLLVSDRHEVPHHKGPFCAYPVVFVIVAATASKFSLAERVCWLWPKYYILQSHHSHLQSLVRACGHDVRTYLRD